jgi:hypothetical protein
MVNILKFLILDLGKKVLGSIVSLLMKMEKLLLIPFFSDQFNNVKKIITQIK